jgi:hypothetical protein
LAAGTRIVIVAAVDAGGSIARFAREQPPWLDEDDDAERRAASRKDVRAKAESGKAISEESSEMELLKSVTKALLIDA